MEILNSIKNLLVSWGMAPGTADALDHFIAFTVLVLIALAADQVCRRVVLNN
jgi:miniconductance mechanosensitive channel